MRAPIFRNPGEFAAIGLLLGVVGKLMIDSSFSVGWMMVAVLWVLPLVSVGIVSEYFPGTEDIGSSGRKYFSSRENRLELLATLALPGIGFAIDIGFARLLTLAALAVGGVGVAACVQLARIRRGGHTAGHDL
jgi:hypothetical protein